MDTLQWWGCDTRVPTWVPTNRGNTRYARQRTPGTENNIVMVVLLFRSLVCLASFWFFLSLNYMIMFGKKQYFLHDGKAGEMTILK